MSKSYFERLDPELVEPIKKSVGQAGMDLSNPLSARILSDKMSTMMASQRTGFMKRKGGRV